MVAAATGMEDGLLLEGKSWASEGAEVQKWK